MKATKYSNFREVTVGKIERENCTDLLIHLLMIHVHLIDQLMKKAGIRTVINLSDSQEEL